MTFEQKDFIADAVTPLLLTWCLLSIWVLFLRGRKGAVRLYLLQLVSVAVIVYGGMMIDAWLHIWPAFGLDYSTHTAAALALVILGVVGFQYQPQQKFVARVLHTAVLVSVFFAYTLLMWLQQYHSVLDMLTTALFIGPLCYLACLGLARAWGKAEL